MAARLAGLPKLLRPRAITHAGDWKNACLRFAAERTVSSASAAEASSSPPPPPLAWPERSFTFEPPWESGIPSALRAMPGLITMPNMLETYSCMKEACKKLKPGLTGQPQTTDDFNQRLMERLVAFHGDVELSASSRRQVQAPSSPQERTLRASVRLDVGSATARELWSAERPYGCRPASWQLIPQSCQVVQARRAEHHGLSWLQVVTRIEAEERWSTGRDRQRFDSRLRLHFIVFELPRDVAEAEFRVSEMRLDIDEND
eukprot:TRINITY_DN16914_c0_g2_i1.p1 TRINITY_DN16914_c0_g2~~TRINITY_DN16914_c0_g2_i1.p1  ORF type:complete len:260 (+),score=57.08 TRINITY_DN16914_c0_g2_i1:82-861(+)